MSTKVTWHGHACFSLDVNQHKILIDPFLKDNPVTAVTPDSVEADFIVVSHGHSDHVGDTVAIAKRTGATVISNFEIANWLVRQGVDQARVHPQHIGGGFRYPFGYLKLTIAHHGSGLPDGSYGGSPAGLLFTMLDDQSMGGLVAVASNQLLREQVQSILGSLSRREREVLEMRFGLKDGQGHTLEEVGQVFSITRERIRQIEAKALRNLQHPFLSPKKLYFACDTGLFYDMKLIGDEGIDLAILPIGDNFTMGPADALRAVKLISPNVVIPVHYNTWELIAQDPGRWAERVEAETNTTCVVISPGESYALEN